MSRCALVVQRRMTHYRAPFFNCLREHLAAHDIELRLAYGQCTSDEATKGDSADIPWARRLPTRYFLGGRICWQSLAAVASGCDIVVMTHENKLILNLLEQFRRSGRRVALWGHGANLQSDPGSARERFKRLVARQADWWFGYTSLSVPLIRKSGFPLERITVLNNAVDTQELAALFAMVTPATQTALRERLGLQGSRVGVFVGSLYTQKRVDLMLEAALRIRQRVPDFEFLIMGSGPDLNKVERFCAANSWAYSLGVVTGWEKAAILSLGRVMLNPGLVGLGILDSFVCGVPMLTMDRGGHSPEIAYLENGVNGAITANSMDDYVQAVCAVLTDDGLHAKLHDGCVRSAGRYTIENMASEFSAGVEQCLAAPIYRGRT
jgi:glycosyltransferase involved in cell wall biosynthesis